MISLLEKYIISITAVDRTVTSSLTDAREAIVNAAIDTLQAYGTSMSTPQKGASLVLNKELRLVPMFCLALLKSVSIVCVSLL